MHARVHMNCCSSPATRLLFQDRKKQPADPRPEHLRETPQSTRGAGGSDYRHEVMGLQLGGRPRPRVGMRSRSSIAGRFWYAQHIARNGATPSGEAGGNACLEPSCEAPKLPSQLPRHYQGRRPIMLTSDPCTAPRHPAAFPPIATAISSSRHLPDFPLGTFCLGLPSAKGRRVSSLRGIGRARCTASQARKGNLLEASAHLPKRRTRSPESAPLLSF